MHHRSSSTNLKQHDWQVLAGLLPYLADFKVRVGLALALLIVAKLANVVVPITLKYIVDALDVDGGMQAVIAIPLALIFAYGFFRFSSVVFGELRDAVFARVAERTLSKITLSVFRHLHTLDLAFHLDRKTGGLSRDMERGTNAISFLLRAIVFSVIPIFLEVILVASIMAYSADYLFAVVILTAVVAYVSFSIWMTNKRTVYIRDANNKDSEANTRAVDSLLNFETVKYFNNEDFEQQRYSENLKLREEAKIKNLYSLAALNSGQALIIGVCVSIIMFMAANKVASGDMTIGDLAMINAFMLQVFIPLNALGFIYREIRRMLTDVEEMFKLLEIEPKIKDSANAKSYKPAIDALEFSHVNFGYSQDRQILKDVSFTVGAGEKVAIVGPSGSGKSTLAKLLFRFYEADSGDILVNNQSIKDFSLVSWRQALGVVPQDTVLFNSSIGENISYGNPQASSADVAAVTSMAHLAEFIEALPKGLDTLVGERGLKVSGGEKQRIAIARMLLKKPSILIFDEATSSLDSAAEQAIIEALDEVAKDHTAIVIAHRLSTIVDADKIIVLKAGRVVEVGSHTDLLKTQGLYSQLWQIQQQEL
jgi:ABC-type transport system involved in Fe-S cluster assembly fused permease/ATPase subunit